MKDNLFKNVQAFSSFSVDDLQKAKQFYGDTLGLSVHEEDNEMGLTLELESGIRVFIYPKKNHTPATFTVLNFPVPDIDEAADALAELGIALERYEGFHQDEKGIARSTATSDGPDVAWFKDPAGNVLSILEE